MSIYITITVYSLLLVILSHSKLKNATVVYRNRKVNLVKCLNIILVLLFFFVMALRNTSVGIDTNTYSRIYHSICYTDSLSRAINSVTFTGQVYIAISWLVSRVTDDFKIILIISAAVVNFGLYRFLNKISKNMAVSLFIWIGIGLFYFSMNGNRQMMAAVLLLNAFEVILCEKKWIKGIILIIIAVGFHPTSTIMVVGFFVSAYVATRVISSTMIFLVSLIAGIFTGTLFVPVINLILRILPQYNKYTISMDGRATIFENSGGGRIVYLYIVLLAVCVLWCFIKDYEDVTFEHKCFAIIVFALGFGIINSRNVYVSRMLLYYLTLYTVFFPGLIYKMKNTRIAISVCILGVMLLFSIFSLIENQNGIVPYDLFEVIA